MLDLSHFILGESDELLSINSSVEQLNVAANMILQARRSVDIFSRDLDKKIYDNATFLAALQNMAVIYRGQIRILVKNSGEAVKNGHRLISLSQRLTSFIEIRKVADDYKEYNQAFLVVDATGFIHRRNADRFVGSARFNAIKEASEFLVFFNEVWRHSAPDPDM